MCSIQEFFFALFNQPREHDIKVENGAISAVGKMPDPANDELKMDMVDGFWVNKLGTRVIQLKIPRAA